MNFSQIKLHTLPSEVTIGNRLSIARQSREKNVYIGTYKKSKVKILQYVNVPRKFIRCVNAFKYLNTILTGSVPELLYFTPCDNSKCKHRNHWMIVSWVDGKDLQQLLSQSSISQNWEKLRTSITDKLLRLIGVLQQHRWVHGDLKMENVVYQINNNKLYLIDLEFSHNVDAIIHSGGTKAYLSPERIFKDTDFRLKGSQTLYDECWTLGCLLFEIYTKKTLYRLRDILTPHIAKSFGMTEHEWEEIIWIHAPELISYLSSIHQIKNTKMCRFLDTLLVHGQIKHHIGDLQMRNFILEHVLLDPQTRRINDSKISKTVYKFSKKNSNKKNSTSKRFCKWLCRFLFTK
mgnify:CR=1 FL=1